MSRIRILIPGKSFTQGFMRGMLSLTAELSKSDINFTISNYYGPYLPEVRNQLLLNNQTPTANIVPFGGEYDYVLWIETDIAFKAEDFFKLYSSALKHDLDFVTGLFPMNHTNPNHAVAGTWREGRLPMNSHGLHEIDYCGVGFLLVRKGVYESLAYPWYGAGEIYKYDEGRDVWYYLGDDFSTAKRIQSQGWKLWANGDVKLGHEKMDTIHGEGI